MGLKEDGRIVRFLERMEDYTRETIPEENISSIVNVLINIGDKFPEGPKGIYSTDTSMRIMRIMYQLSSRFDDQDKRFELFKQAMSGAEDSLYTVVREVGIQGQQHGKRTTESKEQLEPEENRTVSSNQLEELEAIACVKIQQWAKDGRLKNHPNLISILYSWKHWCENGEAEAKDFVKNMTETKDDLVVLITAFIGKSYSHGMSDYVSRENWRISLDSVNDFIDANVLEQKVRPILGSENFNSLTVDQQKALNVFIDTFDGKVENW